MLKALIIKLLTAAGVAGALVALPAPSNLAVAAGVLTLGLGVIAWGVFHVNSSLWARTLWRGAGKRVALTFDDGPDPEYTPQILEVLADKGVKAGFFCVGQRVREHPDIVRRIRDQGHLVGNHSDSHAMWINFGLHSRLRREIDHAGDAIEAAIGERPRLYRAPHGFKNPALGDVLKKLGMLAVGWQVRGFDAVSANAAKITERIVNGAKPGGVILLHDGSGLQGSDDRSATVDALPVIIDGLRARGYEVVRLDELLGVEAYSKPKPIA